MNEAMFVGTLPYLHSLALYNMIQLWHSKYCMREMTK